MELDSHAFQGDSSADRKSISVMPYNYKNTLTMKSRSACICKQVDLPKLTTFSLAFGANFEYMGTVTIESWAYCYALSIRHPETDVQWYYD